MSYDERDNRCIVCHCNQQIGIMEGRLYRTCKECVDEDEAMREDADDAQRELLRERQEAFHG